MRAAQLHLNGGLAGFLYPGSLNLVQFTTSKIETFGGDPKITGESLRVSNRSNQTTFFISILPNPFACGELTNNNHNVSGAYRELEAIRHCLQEQRKRLNDIASHSSYISQLTGN